MRHSNLPIIAAFARILLYRIDQRRIISLPTRFTFATLAPFAACFPADCPNT
jgi:hypothetical protein